MRQKLALSAFLLSYGLIVNAIKEDYNTLKNSQAPFNKTIKNHRDTLQILAYAINKHLQLIDEITENKNEGFQFRLKKEN